MEKMNEDYELTLYDRINVIKTTINKYGEDNFYISFSGGKDSTILHYLIDMSLPNNRIPRVFINTGIEYNDIVQFVKVLASKDDRFIILNPTQAIKPMLAKYGYPFKSKQHSHILYVYQHGEIEKKSVRKYLKLEKGSNIIKCPNNLRYQFTSAFDIKISDMCCYKLKKEPIAKWQKTSNKNITITGMRANEGGQRAKLTGCIVTDKEKNLIKFHPLVPISEEFEEWFINKYNIQLCKLYYAPYNFKRTGCRGCPYSLELQEQLDVMEKYLPNEKKACELIWKPIYEEYRRINYRLKSSKQLTIDDYIEKGDK